MGGRGSVSVTGGKIGTGSLFGPNDIHNVGGAPDDRAGIKTMFENELGFTGVNGLKMMDTAVLGAYGIALNNLERKYGALKSMDGFEVLGFDSDNAIAAVRYDKDGNANGLLINRKKMGNISDLVTNQQLSSNMGWNMPTDKSLLKDARYTITHEYGHIVETALWKKARAGGSNISEGQYAASVARDIMKIAKNKYGASNSDISTYGTTNTYEFFAEAFASANSGNPNAIGKATNDYLKKNRI